MRCTKGKILDVAVDLRKDSETFCHYFSIELTKKNNKMLYIPKGFAHGFMTLSEVAEVQYKVDNEYAPEEEAGIIWNDPKIDIDWPMEEPKLSDKDEEWPSLREARE